jgi:hypothetical protein
MGDEGDEDSEGGEGSEGGDGGDGGNGDGSGKNREGSEGSVGGKVRRGDVFDDSSNNSSGARGCGRGQEADNGEGVTVAADAVGLGRGKRWKSHCSSQSLSSSTLQCHFLVLFACGDMTSGGEGIVGCEGGSGSVFTLAKELPTGEFAHGGFPPQRRWQYGRINGSDDGDASWLVWQLVKLAQGCYRPQ